MLAHASTHTALHAYACIAAAGSVVDWQHSYCWLRLDGRNPFTHRDIAEYSISTVQSAARVCSVLVCARSLSKRFSRSARNAVALRSAR